MDRLVKLVATGAGLGYLPKAPGTWGTLGALLISFGIIHLGPDPFPNLIHIVLAFGTYIKGVYVCKKLIPVWGDDPAKIVIDEFCGLWVALIFSPPSIIYYLIGFLLFRFFDITKIMGISRIDSIKGPHAIMLDDVLAGIYAGIATYAIYFFDIIPI